MAWILSTLVVGILFVAGRDVHLGVDETAFPAGPAVVDTDTVLLFDSGVSTTWWCSDRDSFGTAVRFTPPEYPCEVTGARAEVNRDGGQEVYLRIWDDDGPGGEPGSLLYHQQRPDIPPRRTPGFRDYDLTEPVTVDSGDFYVCFWQQDVWDLQFSSDETMDYPARQWWFFPDQGWVTPSGMHASDHLIRARVRYGTGVVEELGTCLRVGLTLHPNPAPGGRCHVRWAEPRAGMFVTLLDVSGRAVRSSRVEEGSTATALAGLEPGVYLVSLCWRGGRDSRSLVVLR
jgi:hypothetical protein